MNDGRRKSLIEGLSGIARKVYDAVPIREAWGVDGIMLALRQNTGTSADKRTVQGCLANLVRSGLAIETHPGSFIRSKERKNSPVKFTDDEPVELPAPIVAIKPIKPYAIIETEPMNTLPIASPANLLQRIDELSRSFDAAMINLKGLQSELEAVAIEAADYIKAVDEETKELRDLAQVMKRLKVFAQ